MDEDLWNKIIKLCHTHAIQCKKETSHVGSVYICELISTHRSRIYFVDEPNGFKAKDGGFTDIEVARKLGIV